MKKIKRFKRLQDLQEVKHFEKLEESQKLEIYHAKYREQKKLYYDINKWSPISYYKDENGEFIEKKTRYNRFNYLFKDFGIFKFFGAILKRFFDKNNDILYYNGVHLISGYPGAGKTLLSNNIIKSVDKNKYFFYTTREQYKSENVYFLDMNEIFCEKQQKKSIPVVDKKGRKLFGIILEEINLEFNKRLNRTNDYNEQFIGLIEFIVSHRHQGIPRIYAIGQKLELQDTQLQSLFMYHHFIKKRKNKYSYQLYREKGDLKSIPKKLIVENYAKNEVGEFYKVSTSKFKINRYILGTYSTHYLNEQYKELESYEIK